MLPCRRAPASRSATDPRGAPMTFTGFRPAAIQFLADLAANNERGWFQPRKAEYERLLKEPLEALCAELRDRLATAGLPLEADPRRSPFRIYRDTRFSKDKSPYKTHVAAGFPMTGGVGIGGYFSFGPGEIYAGGGMHMPDPTRLAAFRAAGAADPRRLGGGGGGADDPPAPVGTGRGARRPHGARSRRRDDDAERRPRPVLRSV